jgi:hypothetical protein
MALDSLTALGLRGAEQAALLAAVRWVDFGTGEMWPALPTWARLAGLSDRGLQRVLGRLTKTGIVEVLEPSRGGASASGRGYTTRYKIPALALNPNLVNPDPGSGLNPDRRAPEPRPPRRATPTGATSNPDRGSGDPSIHPPKRPSINPSMRAGAFAPGMDGCPPEPTDVRSTLTALGVRGANLALLAEAPGMSVQAIRDEHERIRQDRRVRNVRAVLAKALADRFGIALKKSGALAPELRQLMSTMERLRRNRAWQAEGGTHGE